MADLAALRNVATRLDSALDSRAVPPALEREAPAARDRGAPARPAHPGGTAGQAESFSAADLIGQLDGTDLLELTDVDGQLHAVVVTGGRLHLVHVGPTQAAVHSLAHALFALRREGAARGSHRLDLDEIGRRLELNLLGDSIRLLGDGPLVVVPTGKLHAVPWGMLPSLRDRPTAVTPSASAWLRARHAARPDEDRVVLVGGPRLLTGDAEVRALTGHYPDATVLADGDATADRVMAAMDGAWLVHMAAHGTFRDDSPLFSAIELADGPLTVYDLERLKQAPLPCRAVQLQLRGRRDGRRRRAPRPGQRADLARLRGRDRQRRPGQRPRHRPPDDRLAQAPAGRDRPGRRPDPRPARHAATTP